MDELVVGLLGAGWLAFVVIAASARRIPVGAAVLAVLAYFGVAILVILLME
jgi:hypothetical protein